MHRRNFLASLGAAAAASGQTVGSRPNVVILLFDKLRTDAVGAYGGNVGTPRLDWLASTGVRFANCYTPQALCGPARASIITGMYPHAHGLRRNVYPVDPAQGNHNVYPEPVPDPFIDRRFRLWNNFPHLLHTAGYETAQIGKWHLGPGNPGFFDTWKGFNSLLPHWVGKPHESAYRPDVHTDQGIDFIERNARRPFFLYQSYYAPHEPLDPPKKYLGKHGARANDGYYGAVENLDWNVGRILDTLRKQEILDRTLIVFSTEHGRAWTDRPGTREGMSIAYDDAARIPLILRYPGALPQGKVWNAGVSLVDLMPTILDAANITARSPVRAGIPGNVEPPEHGRSLLAEVRSGRDAWTRPVVTENLSQREVLGSQFEDRGLRFERWKLILRRFDKDPRLRLDELYDLESDPGETRNLYKDPGHRARRADLRSMLGKWAAETGDKLGAELAAQAG
ncbi:MAG TPA: sulfatase-like hydrolase/transferase [Bryobacteraceae bacterium]|jgi:arylsulfatase A-like enzyme|nr:sulfatase-like hydrolase/transferase [Bryobacteraceae bacterium]